MWVSSAMNETTSSKITGSTDPVIFYWKQNRKLVGIQICHVDNIDST